MTNLTDPIFTNEEAARAHFEALRWPDGRMCPHCGTFGNSALMQGKSTRPGLYKCRDCRKPFSALIGTVYEGSKIPLHKWLLATHLMVSSKKGISAHQLFRMLGFGSYRTAWFMAHRIREAMRAGELDTPFGSDGGAVEVDETYFGHLKGQDYRQGGGHKMKVISLVDRNSGQIRSYDFDQMISTYVEPICKANIAKEATLMTDGARLYRYIGKFFADHQSVDHSKDQWRKGDCYTNTVEGSFSIFKRGMKGVYQHCGEQHLHRYLAEFDFRYCNRIALGITDAERAEKVVQGAIGRRLTYQQADQRHAH